MPAIPAIIMAGASIGGSLISANTQSSAADKARDAQEKAANDAARLQKEAADNTLAFEKQQAVTNRADSITAQKASYDQWLYRQGIARPYQNAGLGANNTLAQMLGLPPQITGLPDTPPPARFSGEGDGLGGSSGGPAPTIDPSKDIAPQVSAYFKSRGVSDSETPYWAQKWNEFGKNDPEYFGRRLADADIFNG